MVASQTQGPLNGRIERPVKHHIVHSWGLNQLRKLHGPQRPRPEDCSVQELEGGYSTAGLKTMTPRRAGPRGGVRGGETGPRPRPGWARRGLRPLALAAGGPGSARPGRFSSPPGPPQTPDEARESAPRQTQQPPSQPGDLAWTSQLRGEGGSGFRASFQVPATRESWRK